MSSSSPEGADFAVQPIARKKLSEQVFERLWEMIYTGKLAPGDAIPSERVLMERFQVGRPAVREALQALANKGVITISHGERSRVNEINANVALKQIDELAKLLLSFHPSNLENLKQVRKILEAGTVRYASAHATARDVAKLRSLIERQSALLSDVTRFIQADIEFHAAIVAITGNPLLESVFRAMLDWLFEYYKPVLHWPGREDTTLSEHKRIVDFIEAKEADKAAKLVQGHIDRSEAVHAGRGR